MGHYAKLRRKLSASRQEEEEEATNQQQDSFQVTKELVDAVSGKRPAKVERILQSDDSAKIILNDPRLKRCLLDTVRHPGYLVNQEIAILLIKHGLVGGLVDLEECLNYAVENANEDILEYLMALFRPGTLMGLCRNVIRRQILLVQQRHRKNLAPLVNRLDSIPLHIKHYLMLKWL